MISGNPELSKSLGIIFHFFPQSICSFYVSVSYFDSSHNISNVFIIIIFVIVIYDQESLMLIIQKD